MAKFNPNPPTKGINVALIANFSDTKYSTVAPPTGTKSVLKSMVPESGIVG